MIAQNEVNVQGELANLTKSNKRLKKSDCTIVKFSRRKDCQHPMHIKKGPKDLNPTNLSFPEGIKIYVNDSLCPYYRGLWNEWKKLWSNKKIYQYFTVNGTVRIKQVENGPYKNFTHINDLKALFPQEQISMSRVVQVFTSCCVRFYFVFIQLAFFFLVFSISVMYLAIF